MQSNYTVNRLIALAYVVFAGLFMQGCNDAFDVSGDGYYVPAVLPVDSTVDPPSIRVGIGIETGDFTLSWGDVPEATGYELEESSFGLGVRVHWMRLERQYLVGRVAAGRQYTYRVRALKTLNVTRWSEAVTVP